MAGPPGSSLVSMGFNQVSRAPGSAQSSGQQGPTQQWVASSQMSAPQPHRQSNNQFSPGQNSIVSNIKNIYKDIKREKSSGAQVHLMAQAQRANVNRNNSAHSRTNSQAHNTPGAHSTMKVSHLQASANQSQTYHPVQVFQQAPPTGVGVKDGGGFMGGAGGSSEMSRRPAPAIGSVKVRESPSQSKNHVRGRAGIGEKLNSQRMSQQLVKQPSVATNVNQAAGNTFV